MKGPFKRIFAFTQVACTLAACVNATVKDTGTPMSRSEIQSLVYGKTVSAGTSRLTFDRDGRYQFTFGNGVKGGAGRYRIEEGRICVDFDSGRSRCDRYMKQDGQLYLVDQAGAGYLLKPEQ
jgi:hypothetical protein